MFLSHFCWKMWKKCKFSHGYDVILISNYANLSKICFVRKKILWPFRKYLHVYSFGKNTSRVWGFFVRHPFSVKMQWHIGYRKGTWGVALKGLNDNCILWLKLEFLWYVYVNLKHKYVIFWQQLLKLQKQVFNARKHRRYILQVWETHKTALCEGIQYLCMVTFTCV